MATGNCAWTYVRKMAIVRAQPTSTSIKRTYRTGDTKFKRTTIAKEPDETFDKTGSEKQGEKIKSHFSCRLNPTATQSKSKIGA